VARADAAGAWTVETLSPAVGDRVVSHVGVGPLGIAALYAPKVQGTTDFRMVTSTDGRTFTVTPVGDLIGPGWLPAGITVDADAVVLRLSKPDAASPAPGAQRLLVGTP
jgi:hypothetical protein